ncbi:hypothetical protein GO988_15420 [Hymenobacter sp. HMF4947]|uniref:Uncharacterized protein n=1 Tax=Hymenobacter ginkgonis TaxID=2682976 RepID=A0A7K1THB1_9BACT|nr:hypothetical protein [Hymenobacter ginkgonis]MVN77722.1 hypothetical protein [Hymenobacter ginkgonis]
MCPTFSCCHPRRASLLSTQLHCLVRLLLASGTPELRPEPAGLSARLDALWLRTHGLMQTSYCVSAARARELTENALSALLSQECCCQAVRERLPLGQALGRTRVLYRAARRQRAAKRALAAH